MGLFQHFPNTNFHDLNLDWILEQVASITKGDAELQRELAQIRAQVAENKLDITQLKALLDKIKNGDYVDLYLDSLINYIDNNLQELVGRIAKFPFFGLTDDGYFFADIPESWSDINFNTIYDVDSPYYGHLVLEY